MHRLIDLIIDMELFLPLPFLCVLQIQLLLNINNNCVMKIINHLPAHTSCAQLCLHFADTNPGMQERGSLYRSPWTANNRQQLLENLEPSLFTEALAPLSDSSCSLAEMEAPSSLCRQVAWLCNHSPTFATHHSHNRYI